MVVFQYSVVSELLFFWINITSRDEIFPFDSNLYVNWILRWNEFICWSTCSIDSSFTNARLPRYFFCPKTHKCHVSLEAMGSSSVNIIIRSREKCCSDGFAFRPSSCKTYYGCTRRTHCPQDKRYYVFLEKVHRWHFESYERGIYWICAVTNKLVSP